MGVESAEFAVCVEDGGRRSQEGGQVKMEPLKFGVGLETRLVFVSILALFAVSSESLKQLLWAHFSQFIFFVQSPREHHIGGQIVRHTLAASKLQLASVDE